MKLLIVCLLAIFIIFGCFEQGSNTTQQGIQKQLAEIDNVAWYVKLERGAKDSKWESVIRVDTGGISSKTFMFEADTFEGVVHKTWVKCKELSG